MQEQLHQLQELFCIAVMKPEVTHSAKSFGENMLQDQTQKILALEGMMDGGMTRLMVYQEDFGWSYTP